MNEVFKDIKKLNRKAKKINRNVSRFSSKMNRSINKVARETEKRRESIAKHQQKISRLEQIPVDNMDGYQFEYYLEKLFKEIGYKAKVTNSTGDFGADLIVKSKQSTWVVQAKRYSKKVGVRAVQEIFSAKKYYNADSTVVITNNYFTKSAIELAEINDVLLIDRDGLQKLIAKSKDNSTNKQTHKARQKQTGIKDKKGFFAKLFKL